MSDVLLFSPLSIRGVELRNRIVVPPMHQYSAVKGFPTDWHLMNAGKFAAGGAGLVVVESTKVERRGCGTVGDLGIWDDKFVEPLGRLVKFIKQQNSVAGIQLGHSGRKARASRPWEGDRPLQRTPEIDDWDAWTPVAPSAIAHSEKWPVPKALERGEVKDIVQAWGNAARRAALPQACTRSFTSPRSSAFGTGHFSLWAIALGATGDQTSQSSISGVRCNGLSPSQGRVARALRPE